MRRIVPGLCLGLLLLAAYGLFLLVAWAVHETAQATGVSLPTAAAVAVGVCLFLGAVAMSLIRDDPREPSA